MGREEALECDSVHVTPPACADSAPTTLAGLRPTQSSRGPPTRDRPPPGSRRALARSAGPAFAWILEPPSILSTVHLPIRVSAILPRLTRLLRSLFPSSALSTQSVDNIVRSAVRAADDDYGETEALTWAQGFCFPSGIAQRDHDGLVAHEGDLSAYIRSLHSAMSSTGRLSAASITASVPASDPDFDTLLALVEGIPIVTDPTLLPSQWLPATSTCQVQAHGPLC